MSPYKDPARKAAYNRSYNAKKREAGLLREKKGPFKLESARDLQEVLALSIDEVLDARLPPEVRARCISALVNSGLKCLELSDLTQRVENLENHLMPRAVR